MIVLLYGGRLGTLLHLDIAMHVELQSQFSDLVPLAAVWKRQEEQQRWPRTTECSWRAGHHRGQRSNAAAAVPQPTWPEASEPCLRVQSSCAQGHGIAQRRRLVPWTWKHRPRRAGRGHRVDSAIDSMVRYGHGGVPDSTLLAAAGTGSDSQQCICICICICGQRARKLDGLIGLAVRICARASIYRAASLL